MFYDRFASLCENKKIAPSTAAIEAGISKSLVSKWKKDRAIVPTTSVLEKLSKYFGISISELLGEEKEKPTGHEAGGLTRSRYEELNAENRRMIDDLIAHLLKSQSDE